MKISHITGDQKIRYLMIAAAFTLVWLIFEVVVLFPGRELAILNNHLADGNVFRPMATGLVSLASIGLTVAFIWAALVSDWRYRIFYIIVFVFVIAVEYAIHLAVGRYSTFGLSLVGRFVGNYTLFWDSAKEYFSLLSIVPITAFFLLLASVRPASNDGLKTAIFLVVANIVFFSASTCFTQNEYFSTSLSAGARTAVEFPIVWYSGIENGWGIQATYWSDRAAVDFVSPSRPKNNIVFIVDESIRGDHLSLNGYGNPTTPLLVDLERTGKLKNWGLAVSGGTCSTISNEMLLTGVKPGYEADYMGYLKPTIFQFAKAMNYTTYRFDGQATVDWMGKQQDLAFLDKRRDLNDAKLGGVAKYQVDAVIAEEVNRIVSTSVGNFIWINKAGVHKPYTDAYISDSVDTTNDGFHIQYGAVSQQELVTTYDSGITYNVRSFFSALLPDLSVRPENVYLYTSDHGQTLMENGSAVSHCSDTRPEATVPLFIIADREDVSNADTTYPASHANLFATMLDLMNVPAEARHFNYAPSLLKAKQPDSERRFYITGYASARDQGAVPYD